jgi:uncharacterized membrane protein
MMRWLSSIAVSAALALLGDVSAANATYIFQSFEIPNASQTSAQGIHDAGQIVGYSQDRTTGDYSAFLKSAGGTTTLPSEARYALGINAPGQIVGLTSSVDNGFLYSGGSFSSIVFPGSSLTVATGINASGEIVGIYENPGSSANHGFLDIAGVFTPLDLMFLEAPLRKRSA